MLARSTESKLHTSALAGLRKAPHQSAGSLRVPVEQESE